MILIYAYIISYKNYINQGIVFDPSYAVDFRDGILSITYHGPSSVHSILRGNKKPDNLHLLVGKTGSGKTNLLQLIGSKLETRQHRKWNGENDSYFLMYALGNSEFFLEICDVDIKQFPLCSEQPDHTIPKSIRPAADRMNTIRTVRFAVSEPMQAGKSYQAFTYIPEYGYGIKAPERTVSNTGMVINCYDIHAFITPPYPDEKEDFQDFRNDWLGRMVMPYHRTSLWHICDYIREYLNQIEPGRGKKQTAFVLSTHNFSDNYPLKLPNAVESDYWTFYGKKRAEMEAEVLGRKKKAGPKNRKKQLTNKQMFIHDLWTDYGMYLRKWIEKIHSFNAEEEIPEDHLDASGAADVYQEFIDYYAEKEYHEDIDPTDLPDGMPMSVVKRCTWLAEYIDRIDGGDPHGVLWQIIDDIKDIGRLLNALDDKYFTIDTCTIPVVDMALPRYQSLFENLFERMEQYHPDNAGIFTERLLPYFFTHLSTGEYQYAKVLGGLKDYLKLHTDSHTMIDKIILLDEPESYMHPELARNFFAKLHELMENYVDDAAIQVIIGTHSPFMLSDVLSEEITRLDIDQDTGNAIVMSSSGKEYFGANIHTILADGFFLNYTIGECSRAFLQEAYDRLRQYTEGGLSIENDALQFIRSMRILSIHIGDQLIRRVFENMLRHLPQ